MAATTQQNASALTKATGEQTDQSVTNEALFKAIENLAAHVKDLSNSVKNMRTQLSQMQESIAFAQTTAIEAKTDALEANKKIDELEKKLEQQQKTVNNLTSMCKRLTETNIHQEAYSRRDNLLFSGLPEQGKDENCTQIILKLLTEKLGFSEDEVNNIRIVRCHRLGPAPRQGMRPRSIICKFHWFGDRQSVFSKASRLKGSATHISEDYPKEIVYRRNVLAPIMFAARGQQKNAHLSVDKLIIEGRVYTVNDLDKLPEDLSPCKIGVTKVTNEVSAFFGAVSPLSNFYPAPFTDERDGRQYHSFEQYLQCHRALLFEDELTASAIMTAQTPAECKVLLSLLSLFGHAEWTTLMLSLFGQSRVDNFNAIRWKESASINKKCKYQ